MKLNYKRTILVGFAFFLISAFWQAYDAIVPLVLSNHFGLPETVSGVVMSIDNILAVFMLPIFGALSDKVMTKFGRRTPFIVVGTMAAVISFILLTIVNGIQLNALTESGIVDNYRIALDSYNVSVEAINAMFDRELITEALRDSQLAEADAAFEAAKLALKEDALELTLSNIWPLVGFIGVLLIVLISMATFRSPAVALMPDVTVKPLRSKGNAIINLMGTAGGIIVLAFSSIFGITKDPYMSFTGYVIAACIVMLAGLAVFLLTVKEKKWAEEMELESARLGLNDSATEAATSEKDGRSLSKEEMKSLFLILASVALWYIGYNSITSKYSVYSTNVLGVNYGLTLIVAQAAAIVAYIPVGIVASKFGRRKTILAGIAMLTTAFLIGNFIGRGTNPIVMYPIFALAGIGWATINVNSFPMVVELAKGGQVGKYTGYYYTASMAAQIVAPVLSGILYDLFTMRVMFFLFGTIFVALSFVTMFFVKHGDAKAEKQDALSALGGADD
ncbi:MAG: MFS transporter [Clostridia bacterium]|nr:MFS transporter [Clostridia bacterium]